MTAVVATTGLAIRAARCQNLRTAIPSVLQAAKGRPGLRGRGAAKLPAGEDPAAVCSDCHQHATPTPCGLLSKKNRPTGGRPGGRPVGGSMSATRSAARNCRRYFTSGAIRLAINQKSRPTDAMPGATSYMGKMLAASLSSDSRPWAARCVTVRQPLCLGERSAANILRPWAPGHSRRSLPPRGSRGAAINMSRTFSSCSATSRSP